MTEIERCKTCPVRLAGGSGEGNEGNIMCVIEDNDSAAPMNAKRVAEDTYMRFRYVPDATGDVSFDESLERLQNSAECLLQNKFLTCSQFLINEAAMALRQAK